MKVKVYEAATMQEAIAKVKRDLGPEAVILFTKKFPVGGFLGLFRKEKVEVTAGLNINTIGDSNALRKDKPLLAEKKETAPSVAKAAWGENATLNSLQKEVSEIKEALKNLVNTVNEPLDAPLPNPLLKEIEQILIDKEIDLKVVQNFLDGIKVELPVGKEQDMETARRMLCEKIGRQILTSGPIQLLSSGPKIVALIGPTGVGKTTTLAKIAANYSLLGKKKVVFVTADTYRIAAVEQLKVFGNIVEIPVEVVYTAQDLKRVAYKHRDKDLILVDTAGRSPKNHEQMQELKKLLAAVENLEIHLTLSATTNKKDLLANIEKFKEINFHRLLFTKLDEATGLGAILNVAMQVECPISYFTTGQNVPDDIEIAQPDRLSTMILN